MALNRPIPGACLWEDHFAFWGSGPKPTQWELGQAKVTLQQYRGKNLAALPHEELMKVARALRTLSFELFFDTYETGGVARRPANSKSIQGRPSHRTVYHIEIEDMVTLRRYARQPLSSLPVADLLKYTRAIQSIMQSMAE